MSNPSNVTIIAKEYVIDGGFNGTKIISATALASDDADGAFFCTISDLSDYYGKTLTVTPRLTLDGYNVHYVIGNPFTLTVPKKAITLTAASASKAYDGTALVRKSASTADLITGHVLNSYNVVGSQTDAGTSDNVVDQAVVKNANGEDVTEAYEFTYVPGILNVLPREVTVKAIDASKIYGQDDPSEFSTTITGRVPVNALTYTVSRVAGENVGTYTIIPSGEALQGNYRVSYQPGTFTIQPAPVTITVESATKVYGEADPALYATVEGLIGNDVLDFTLSREPGDTVGEYAITVTLGDNPNYNVAVNNGTFTITKADAIVSITGATGNTDYNGSEQQVSGYTVSLPQGIALMENEIIGPANAVAAGTNAGTYSMGLSADDFTTSNNNYHVIFEVEDGSLTINKIGASVTITGHHNTSVYDGQEHAVEGYDVEISNPLYTASDFTFSGTASASRTDVGTSDMGLASSQFANNNSNFTNVTFHVTDGYQQLTALEGVVVTITGHHNAREYDGQEHVIEGYDVEISNPLYTTSDFSFSGNATASRTDVGTSNMGLASDQFANTNSNFAGVTFNVTDGYQQVTALEGVVVTITGHHDASDYNGQAHSVEGYDVAISNPLYTTSYFTFSGNATATRTNAGTSNMGLVSSQFANTNSNFANVTFNVTDGYLTISKINATVTISGHHNTFVYDGNVHVTEGYDVQTSTSLYSANDFSFSGNATASRTDVGTTNMGLAASQFANTNSNFANVTFNVTDGYQTITKASVTVTITGATGSRVYNGGEQQVSGYSVSIPAGVTLTENQIIGPANAVASGTHVGTYYMGLTVDAFSSNNSNYNVSFELTDGMLTITRAAATVTAEAKTKVYGTVDPALTAVVSGLQNGDAANMIQYTISRMAGENAGTYTITPSGDAIQGNYNVTYVPANFTITRATATVTAEAKTKVYGAVDPSLTAVVSGMQNGDAVSVIQYTVNRTTGENVGTYTITPSGAAIQGNYNVTYVPANFTITRAMATVTAEAKTKVYGAAEPSFTTVVSGLQNGDAAGVIQYTVSRTAGENVGTYTITPSGAATQGNYNVTYVAASMTISRATATVTAQSKTKVYGTADPELTAVVSGLRNGDAASVIQYAVSRTAGENAGTYTITPSGSATQGNYDVTYVDAVFTITKASVTVTVTGNTATLTYNGTAQSVSGYELGIPADATLVASEITGPASAVATGTNVGTYAMGLFANQFRANNDNYNVSFAITDGALTITRATAVVKADDVRKYRGEADPPLTVTITGLFGSDVLTYSVSRRSGENPGTYTITPSGASRQGNYNVNYSTGIFTIEMPPCPALGTTTYTPYPLDASTSISVSTVLEDVISPSYISRVYYRVSVAGLSSTTVTATYSNGSISGTIPIQPLYRERVMTVTPYISTTNCANAGINQAGESVEICVPSTVPVTVATAISYPASGLNKTELFSNQGITLKARVANYSTYQVASYGFLISDNPEDIQTYNSAFRKPATFTNVSDTMFTHKIGMEYCKKTWYYRPYMILNACDGEILYGDISSVTMWGPEDYNPTATPITITAGQTVTLSSTAYITIGQLEGRKPIEYYLDPNGEYAAQLAHNGVTYENWTYYWKANGSQIYSSHFSGNATHNPTQTTVYDAYCVFEINGTHCIVNGNPITVTVTQP